MNTMQLACFLAVAETLNFARAAEQLHVTQPAVTQQIHTLEAELNVKLFRRTTRTVALTQAGLVFLGDAKTMFEIAERAKKRAQYAVTDVREPFVIGCHAHNDISVLAPLLKQMRLQFPNLYPVFQIIPFRHLYQRLTEETLDVVVAFQEEGLRKPIQYQELFKIPAVGIVEPDHPLAQAGALHFEDFQSIPVICLNPQRSPANYQKLMHTLLADRSPLDVYFCDSAEACTALAQAGYGIAVIPDFPSFRNPSLTGLPVTDAAPMSYGVYYKTLTGHPMRRAFLRLAKEMLPDHP